MMSFKWAMKLCHFRGKMLKLLQDSACRKWIWWMTKRNSCFLCIYRKEVKGWLQHRYHILGIAFIVWKMMGNPHFTYMSSLLNLKPEERAGLFFGWTSVGLLSCLTAQCDFTVLFLGFLRELFPRPVMLARPSMFPQGPILLWPKLAHCAFWQTQCLSSFVESRTMRSSR